MSDGQSTSYCITDFAAVFVKTELKYEPEVEEDEGEEDGSSYQGVDAFASHNDFKDINSSKEETISDHENINENAIDAVKKEPEKVKSKKRRVAGRTERPRRYKCECCTFVTRYPHAMKGHLATHSEVKPHHCSHCQYSTKHRTALRRHTITVHRDITNPDSGVSPSEAASTCDQCLDSNPDSQYCRGHSHRLYSIPHQAEGQGHLRDIQSYIERDIQSDIKRDIQSDIERDIQSDIKRDTQSDIERDNQRDAALDNIKNISDAILNVIRGIKVESSSKKRRRTYNSKYICDHCQYTTKYKNALVHHMIRHYDTEPIMCTHCDYVTKYPSSMRRHQLLHNEPHTEHRVTHHECDKCDYKTHYKSNLRAHMRKHSAVKQYKCDVCCYETAYSNCFLKHQRSHSRKSTTDVFTCDKCPFTSTYEGRMSWHKLKIHKQPIENAHKCPHCDFSTKVRWRLSIHVQRSLLPQPGICSHCRFETQHKCELKKHRAVHFPPLDADVYSTVPLSALPPPSTFLPLPPSSLPPAEDSPSEPQYEVDETAVRWKDIKVLETRSAEKPFACPSCPYAAKYRASVQRHHQRIHGARQPYSCTHCDFTTRTKDSIGLHVKRSLGTLPLHCRCGFTTNYKCSYALHQKSHNAYRCTLCPYSSRQKYDLEKHYLVHSGAGIQCRFCEFKAIRKDSLLRHEASHTGVKPYKCTLCDYSALRQSSLDAHHKKLHQ